MAAPTIEPTEYFPLGVQSLTHSKKQTIPDRYTKTTIPEGALHTTVSLFV